MKRRLASVAIRVLDWCSALHREECRAFGGEGNGYQGKHWRVCRKWRWHTDSHSYEWVGPS